MTGSRPSVITVSSGQTMRLHRSQDVLRAEFRGEPCISVFDAESAQGGLAILSSRDLESSFSKWAQTLKSLVPQGKLPKLTIKAVARKSDESRLKGFFSRAGLPLATLATFGDGEDLECFFFVDSGRFRVAPFVSTTRAPASASGNAVSATSSASSGKSDRSESVGLGRKARVLIVDDSKTIRQLLRKMIESSPDLEVAGEAERPSLVRGLIAETKPDVMTLDINMPEMTGVELLRQLLPQQFIPTVMISSIGINEGHEVLTAFELGAVDYIHKPSAGEMAAMVPVIQEKILLAAGVRKRDQTAVKSAGKGIANRVGAKFQSSKLIAVGASTGGTEAIKSVFTQFPEDVPPIAVVQHIPPYFSTAFANRLNELCKFEVREAKDGDELVPGLALIAPGGLHMEIRKDGSRLFAKIFDGDPVNRFKPSVDVLFRSVAKNFGKQATGVLLTGMGNDGAKGLLEMKKAGAHTIAQDKESCVVFGMPRAAIEIGAALEVKALEEIPDALMKAA